ncbi:MAG: DNA polymerase III subunit gamma/tau [Gammaproteobacteria bacterium]|nr:DNA polymerase III subunit gamma/tau [Gammaproteobacteria bacterium]
MSYQVLARKWRPRNFSEMVGQEHILRALINALDNDRLHHAFLFTGTRGVGKTTIARILAKSLNCEAGVSSNPCGKCSACQEIDEGRFIDLIEVDAASRTKVEDTRELMDNVQYAPTRGRYKVYLIDEVHMLSNHSFNALLKTLEEPPPHVKFLLATTDPQKLPVTILSRCLQFNLKRLPVKMIADHLADVLKREKIKGDAPAIQALARAADGSMRDALSLLDQAIAHGDGKITDKEVSDMLGTIEQQHITNLLTALAENDGQAVLELVDQLAEQAPDFAGVLNELLSMLHRIALAQVSSEAIDDSLGDREIVLSLAEAVSPEDVQLFYQIGLIGSRDLALAPDPRSGLEMILLRMLGFRPAASVVQSPRQASQTTAFTKSKATEQQETGNREGMQAGMSAGAGKGATTARAQAKQDKAQIQEPELQSQPHQPKQQQPEPEQKVGMVQPTLPEGEDDEWSQIISETGIRAAARELALHSVLKSKDENTIKLVLDPTYEQICTTNAKKRLEQALQKYFGASVTLDISVEEPEAETPAARTKRIEMERHQQAVQSIQQDAVVQDLQKVFNAEVRPDLIRPNE